MSPGDLVPRVCGPPSRPTSFPDCFLMLLFQPAMLQELHLSRGISVSGEPFPLSCPFFRDTAGQERFKTITTAYYRGAMVRGVGVDEG